MTPHTQYDDEDMKRQSSNIINTVARLFTIQSRIDITQHELVSLTRERDQIMTSIDPKVLSAIRASAKAQLDAGAQSD